MSLYYLKGSSSGEARTGRSGEGARKNLLPSRGVAVLPIVLGSVLIAALAIFQALDYGPIWALERRVIGALPPAYQPHLPKCVLLSMGAENAPLNPINPLDLAMALRGIGKLNPALILINGSLGASSESLPLLQGVLTRLREEGVEIVLPSVPSPGNLYRMLPLCSYEPPAMLRPKVDWPSVEGTSTALGKESFLPGNGGPDLTLPLLATTGNGEIAGSLWWRAIAPFRSSKSLTQTTLTGPLWLIANRALILPNHSVIMLDSRGAIAAEPDSMSSTCKEVLLPDFLLKYEQKERGTLSPDFDEIWSQAVVVIGTSAELHRVTGLATELQRVSLRRLPLVAQGAMAALWITMLVGSILITWKARLISAIILMFLSVGISLLALHDGCLLPFLSALLTSLLLLIPFPVLRDLDKGQ